MYSVLKEVISNIKGSETIVDNIVFRLHYKVTCWLLIIFSIVVTSNQFFGDPINCYSTATLTELPEKVVNNYCWISSTFTSPTAFDKEVGIDVVQPGIDKHKRGDTIIRHAYYQWVCFFLFLQAVMFYIPRGIWRAHEGGQMKKIVLGLNSPIIGSDEDMKIEDDTNKTRVYGLNNKKVYALAQFLKDSMETHSFYAYMYCLCEILNVINVIGQIFITNLFLGGQFTSLGAEVVKFNLNWFSPHLTHPMLKVFPRVSKCEFYRFGPTGDVQKHDVLCILPINIINEKIFLFLWFWFIALSFVSFLQIMYRLPIVFIPKYRWWVLRKLSSKASKETLDEIARINNGLSNWFVLRLLQKNLISMNYHAVLKRFIMISDKSI